MLVIHSVTEQEEPPFLSAQGEHKAHHDREGCLVEQSGRHIVQEFSVAVLVRLIEGLDQDLSGTADLIAQRVGDFLLVFQRLIKEHFEGLGSRAEAAAHSEERLEGLERGWLLEPVARVPCRLPGR